LPSGPKPQKPTAPSGFGSAGSSLDSGLSIPTARAVGETTFDLDEYVYGAMRAGASGFLLKDTPARELVAAVRVIALGDALLSPSITKRLIEEFARQPEPEAVAAVLPDDLTEREREALELLAQGLSNREIAAEMYVGEATAKTHVSRLLTKLGVRDRVQAVVLAYETGVVRPGTPARRPALREIDTERADRSRR
jgi:DNA-binding NarL/FixJ family response regulator